MTRRTVLQAITMTALAAEQYRIVDPHVHVRKHDPEFLFAAEAHPPARDAPPETLLVQVIRLSPAAGAAGDWIQGPPMPPPWKRCDSLKVPMTVLAPIARIPEVGRLMADCPVDRPAELDKLIAHTWSLSRQGYPYPDAQESVKRLHAVFGPRRLMWATDWPIVEAVATYDRALRVVRDDMKFLDAEDQRWMLSKPVESVWPFA